MGKYYTKIGRKRLLKNATKEAKLLQHILSSVMDDLVKGLKCGVTRSMRVTR